MKKILITGINGFAAYHLYNLLLPDEDISIFGLDKTEINKSFYKDVKFFQCDITHSKDVETVLKEVMPDEIYHLAAFVHVGRTDIDAPGLFKVNVSGTVNLLDKVRELVPNARILITGSAEVYGEVTAGQLPIKEECTMNPRNLYGLSKKFQEETGAYYQKTYGMDILFTRTFHYCGPYQPLGFVFPDFASQVIDLDKKGINTINTGNLKAQRDFTDIRDVVLAYKIIMEKGIAGQAYNVCSGEAIIIEDILKRFISYTDKEVEIFVDKEKLRPLDVPLFVGNNSRLRNLGWLKKFHINKSIKDIYDYWISAKP